MRPSLSLKKHKAKIQEIIGASVASNPRIFGSVLRGDDVDGSDLDILVDVAPKTTLIDMARLQIDLENLTKVKVDVLTILDLPQSIRAEVLASARAL
ncbi:MAG: putative DNA polymerase [Hyphomonadaceae bacterium]|nr:MAG: putative DNA polymerase [Hyphomonadaceae bacterium]KAF0183441.1 MAG: putative DNA polymerase [Hyphomonadaceae bacterium]